jgi:hypothetical protein
MAYRFPHVLILGKEIHMSKTIAAVSKANIKRPVRKPFSIPDPGSKRYQILDPDQHQRI